MIIRIIILISMLLSLFAQASEHICLQDSDNCALSLTGPNPPINSPVLCESTQTVVYTVENKAFDSVELNPFIEILLPDDTSPTSSVSIITNSGQSTCYLSMPPSVPGQGSCTISVKITAAQCENDDFPEYIVRELVIEPANHQIPLTSPIEVEVEAIYLAIAVAQIAASNNRSYFTSSLVVHDATNTWNLANGIPGGSYFSATCTGRSSTGICLAGGLGSGPILVHSSNGGVTWGNPNITLPASHISGVACNDAGSASICSAVGVEDTSMSTFTAMMFSSTDGGANWIRLTLPVEVSSNELTHTACAKSGLFNICTAVGVNTFSAFPILYIAKNGTVSSISPALPQFTFLNDTACTSTSTNVVCTAVGKNNAGNAVLYLNTDTITNPATWTNPLSITASEFHSTACTTKSNDKVVCTAVGDNGALYVNTNVTNIHSPGSWVSKSVAGILFTSTACKTNGANTVCTASGKNTLNKAILYVSTDGGNNWNPQIISVNNDTIYTGTACTNNGSKIACFVAGGTFIPPCNTPLLFQNSDVTGLGTWQTAFPALSAGGFRAMGASGTSSGYLLCN